MADRTSSRIHFTLDSTLASVHTIEEAALSMATAAGFDADTASNLAMVVREAAANAVIHGNRYSPVKTITASLELLPETLTVVVTDEGDGADIASIPDPLAPENLLRTSGRGIFLMRAFLDEVNFRLLNPGTEITLIKRRAQSA